MKHLILPLLLSLTLAACSSGSDSKKDSKREDNAKAVTDTQRCRDGAPATSLLGTWKADLESEEMNFTLYMRFDNQNVQISNVCSKDHGSATATVTSRYTTINDTIGFLDSDQDEQHYDDGSLKITCTASSNRRNVQYSFQGSCLVLHQENAEDLILVPVNF